MAAVQDKESGRTVGFNVCFEKPLGEVAHGKTFSVKKCEWAHWITCKTDGYLGSQTSKQANK